MLLMRRANLSGLPLRRRAKRVPAQKTVTGLVKRQFTADGPNRLWVTDITEHPAREGKVCCCVVTDVFSRRVVGWAIDTAQRSDLATNALGMAIDSRRPSPGAIIHGDHGTQFTSWAFTSRAKSAGLLPSLGTVGDPCANAVVESFWGARRPSCPTGSAGGRGSSSRTRSSSTSKGSTTAAGATVPSAGHHR
jgi:putative transposase